MFACEISEDGRTLVVAVGDGTISTWNVVDPARPVSLARLPGHADIVDTVSFSADGVLLMSGAGDGRVLLWTSVIAAAPVREGTVDAGAGAVTSMAVGPGDGMAAFGIAPPTTGAGDEGVVRLYHLPGGALADLPPGAGQLHSLSQDGGTLLTANHSGVVTLWDVADPTLAVRLDTIPAEQGNPATSMALGHDGRRVFVGRKDGTVEMWDIGQLRDLTADPVRAACTLTGRGLTATEWRTYVPERPFRYTC